MVTADPSATPRHHPPRARLPTACARSPATTRPALARAGGLPQPSASDGAAVATTASVRPRDLVVGGLAAAARPAAPHRAGRAGSFCRDPGPRGRPRIGMHRPGDTIGSSSALAFGIDLASPGRPARDHRLRPAATAGPHRDGRRHRAGRGRRDVPGSPAEPAGRPVRPRHRVRRRARGRDRGPAPGPARAPSSACSTAWRSWGR